MATSSSNGRRPGANEQGTDVRPPDISEDKSGSISPPSISFIPPSVEAPAEPDAAPGQQTGTSFEDQAAAIAAAAAAQAEAARLAAEKESERRRRTDDAKTRLAGLESSKGGLSERTRGEIRKREELLDKEKRDREDRKKRPARPSTVLDPFTLEEVEAPTSSSQMTLEESVEAARPVPMTVDGIEEQVNPFTGEIVDASTERPMGVAEDIQESLKDPALSGSRKSRFNVLQPSSTAAVQPEGPSGQKPAEDGTPSFASFFSSPDPDEVDAILEQTDYTASRAEPSVEEEVPFEPPVRPPEKKPPEKKEPEPPPAPPAAEPGKEPEPADKGWEPKQERDTGDRERSIENVREWMRHGFFRTSGEKKEGKKRVLSPEVQAERNDTMEFFGLKPSEEHFIWEALVNVDGVTPDMNDLLWRRGKSRKTTVEDEYLIEAWKQIKRNVLDPNVRQPFAYTNPSKSYEGVYRFPVPIVRTELAAALCNGRPENRCKLTPEELIGFGIHEWTRPDGVRDNLNVKGKKQQKLMFHDILDAIEADNGTHMNYAGRIPDSDFTVDEAFDELDAYAELFQNPDAFHESNARTREMARKYAAAAAKEGKVVKRDGNGNITTVRDVVDNPIQWFFRSLVKFVKANALLNPLLFIPSIAEHFQGNITSKMSGLFLRRAYGTDVATDGTLETSQRTEFLDAINDLVRAYSSGDRAGMQAYLAEGGHIGQGRMAQKFKDQVGERKKVDHALARYMAFANQVSSGRIVLKGGEAKRFIQALQFKMQMSMPELTAERFEQMFTANPVGFLETMMQRPEGEDALLFAMDSSVSGVSVFTESFQKLMSAHGVTSFAVTAFVTKFMEYGMRITAIMTPMSHTVTYFLTKGIQKASEKTGRGDPNQVEGLTFGGRDDFSVGLVQNLLLDAAWFGTRIGMLGIIYTVMSLQGVEPPDEEELWGVYGEWKIGGVPIKENWLFRDVLGFVTPVAMAIAVWQKGGDPWPVFVSGAMQTLQGLPIIKLADITDTIMHFDEDIVQAQEETMESWGDEAPSALEFAGVKTMTWGLQMLGNLFQLPFLALGYNEGATLNPNDLTVSNTMIYTPTTEDDPSETMRTTWADSQFRAVARNNPLIAHLLNWAEGIANPNAGVQKTGFLKEERPLVEEANVSNLYWGDHWYVDEHSTPEETQVIVDEVLDMLRTYGSAEEIVRAGYIIPTTARQAAYDYLYGTINARNNQRKYDFAEPGLYTQNGKSYEENQLARSQRTAEDTKLSSEDYALAEKLKDPRIPSKSEKTNQWETDWSVRYNWKDSGAPASVIDFWAKPDEVDETWYPSGDHKSSISPILAVDDRYNMYNAESPIGWFDQERVLNEDGTVNVEESDAYWAELKEIYGDKEVPSGIHKGKNIYELMSSGGQIPLGTGEDWMPFASVGSRAKIPVQTAYEELILLDGNRDGAWYGNLGDAGKKDDTDMPIPTNSLSSGGSWNSGGWGGSSYSKGGSSYTPSIYSHAAYSLNADKPATMYSKSPSYSRFDYLRPGFETKGSREAYKRQDI